MIHEKLCELVEIYALHALEDVQERWVESHLDECGDCEVRLAVALTAIAALVEDAEAPYHLWDRIVDGIERGQRPVEGPSWRQW